MLSANLYNKVISGLKIDKASNYQRKKGSKKAYINMANKRKNERVTTGSGRNGETRINTQTFSAGCVCPISNYISKQVYQLKEKN